MCVESPNSFRNRLCTYAAWCLIVTILSLYVYSVFYTKQSNLVSETASKRKLARKTTVHFCALDEMKKAEFASQNFFSGNFTGVRMREDMFMDAHIFPRMCGGKHYFFFFSVYKN